MKKGLLSSFVAFVMSVNGVSVLALPEEESSVVLDCGREQMIVNIAEAPDFDEIGESELFLSEFTDNTAKSRHIPRFYNYGSDYAYKDIENRDHQAVRRDIYEGLLRACENFAGDYSDVEQSEKYGYILDESTSSTFYIDPEANVNDLAQTMFTVIAEVCSTFRNDHPEYYWISNEIYLYAISKSSNDGDVITVGSYINIYDEYAEGEYRKEIDEKIEKTAHEYIDYVKDSGADDNYSIARLVHDKIIDSVDYAYDEHGQPLDSPQAHGIVGVLDGDPHTNVVCEGYAKTFQLVLNAMNVENIYVTGDGITSNGNEGHAWNMVLLDDGEYYNFDVTWDDQKHEEFQHIYFAKGQGFYLDHIPDVPENTGIEFLYDLPTVPDNDYVPATEAPQNTDVPTTDTPEEEYEVSLETEIVDNEYGQKELYIRFDKTVEDSKMIVVVKDKEENIVAISLVPLEYLEYSIEIFEGYKMEIYAWKNDISKPIAKTKKHEFY